MKKDAYQQFLDLDLSPYSGEWVAILGDKVVSHGKHVKMVFNQAKKKHPGKIPALARVPGKEAWLF